MFRFACVILLGAVALGLPQEINYADFERVKDIYAIYSLLLTNPKTSHGSDDNERYLIAPTTVPGNPRIPCVRPAKEREGDFAEVLADYNRRNATQWQLKPMFSIPKPYLLITEGEVKAFIEERVWPKPGRAPADDRFRGVTDLFRLSDVYFNTRRTLALTAISTFCGGLCGLTEWKVFEKVDGKWEPRQWVMCGTISKNLGLTLARDLIQVSPRQTRERRRSQSPPWRFAETNALRRTSSPIAERSPSGEIASIASSARGMSRFGTGVYRSAMPAMAVGIGSFASNAANRWSMPILDAPEL